MIEPTPVLICVDLQQEFATPGRPWADPDAGRVVAVCRRAIAGAREAGWRLVHTHLASGGPMANGDGLARVIPGCQPHPGEVLLRRPGVSIFSHPEMEPLLAEAEADGAPVVMAGFCAPMSLSASLFDAHDRSRPLALLDEACGGADIGRWSAAQTRAMCMDTAAKLGRLAHLGAFSALQAGPSNVVRLA